MAGQSLTQVQTASLCSAITALCSTYSVHCPQRATQRKRRPAGHGKSAPRTALLCSSPAPSTESSAYSSPYTAPTGGEPPPKSPKNAHPESGSLHSLLHLFANSSTKLSRLFDNNDSPDSFLLVKTSPTVFSFLSSDHYSKTTTIPPPLLTQRLSCLSVPQGSAV